MSNSSSSAAPPRPTCGPYELLVRIGKGGMASVYLARTPAEQPGAAPQLFALKILHPHLAGQQEFVDMLMDEARIAGQLQHPNVVRTVDLGRDDERYYMVMDYVEGVALDRLLRRSEERRPSLIVPLAIDALRGLHWAHSLADELGRPLELVHRDVTPGNIIVGVDGIGRIADFGVAKARARITRTNPGIVKGKAGYVAPEVVLGKNIDGRADVFSMGVLLWNALTGETLFDTDDLASTLTALLRDDVPPPSSVGLNPPPIFDAPILAALHREPSLRYDDAEEMAEALADALSLHGGGGREEIGAWVGEAFGPQLEQRRKFVLDVGGEGRWETEPSEPLSTSGMVRKDPSGRVVVLPAEVLADAEDTTVEASQAGALSEGSPSRSKSGLRIAALLALGLLALIGAGFVGAWIATSNSAPVHDPPPSASPSSEAVPARPEPQPEVELPADVMQREEVAPAPSTRPSPPGADRHGSGPSGSGSSAGESGPPSEAPEDGEGEPSERRRGSPAPARGAGTLGSETTESEAAESETAESETAESETAESEESEGAESGTTESEAAESQAAGSVRAADEPASPR